MKWKKNKPIVFIQTRDDGLLDKIFNRTTWRIVALIYTRSYFRYSSFQNKSPKVEPDFYCEDDKTKMVGTLSDAIKEHLPLQGILQ